MSDIEIKNLSFSYESEKISIPIFNNFNLKVNSGDFIAIKGPSGSGKSTLLYLIGGLLNYDHGEVFINNQEISELNDLELSVLRNEKIGFVFQQFHLLAKTTVLDNILLPTLYPAELLRNEKERKVYELVEELGIADRLGHYPNELSGGQQQRAAIARALINDADIILADEPTGNLDSESTNQIISILKELNSRGKTIILITHEEEVAKAASTIYHFRDGVIVEDNEKRNEIKKESLKAVNTYENPIFRDLINYYLTILTLSFFNAFRNKTRSFLTMIGVIIGVAAVFSLVTLGSYTKQKLLESYSALGANTILFRGHSNWDLKATDKIPLKFQSFNWSKELLPLKKVFPNIELLSPTLSHWSVSTIFAGKSIDKEASLVGVSEDGPLIMGRKLLIGKSFSQYHIKNKHSVCIIGYDIGKRLFSNTMPLNKVIHVSQSQSTFACKIIGVFASKTSNKEWMKPNTQIFIPFTLFQSIGDYQWSSEINEVTLKIKKGVDAEKVGSGIRAFFERKYGQSGSFRIDSDSILVAQMNKFLGLFTILLVVIALISLTVGGIGITNMMLVSVSERLKEIGLRKAVGATHYSIRYQFLFEAMILCLVAGLIGVIIGFTSYELTLYAVSRVIEQVEFEWLFDFSALILSLTSIIVVGIISGLVPALKAEKLQVIEALRIE